MLELTDINFYCYWMCFYFYFFFFFFFFVDISIGITSSAIGFKNCTITAGIKKYKSVIKKKKKYDKIVLLEKS